MAGIVSSTVLVVPVSMWEIAEMIEVMIMMAITFPPAFLDRNDTIGSNRPSVVIIAK